jgi:cobyrinic acid a,c-diamide synthase
MTLIIAGDRSGSGKTTITLAILAALRQKQIGVQSFKVGPDYIDPMFHARITGRPCYNLDPVLTSEDYVQHTFQAHTQGHTHALIEGVMGLFDGAAMPMGFGSTAFIAKLLKIPVLLVVNCQSTFQSIAALIHGYRSFDPTVNVVGVVLNKVASDRHLTLLKAAIEPLNIPIFGVLRREDEIKLPDRHLGLIPTDELPQLTHIFDQLAELGLRCFDWDRLLPLLTTTRTRAVNLNQDLTPLTTPVRIAVARDAAFNFYYADNLELLQTLGAELVEWSPLRDTQLPDGVQGLYLGGGFPEMFAEQLADNVNAARSVHHAIAAELPTYAECGGLMYLGNSIRDFQGQDYAMVGALPTQAIMGKSLTLGYRNAIANIDTPLLRIGDRLTGHEFHRSEITICPILPIYHMRRLEQSNCETAISEGWGRDSLQASYLHLHWGSTPEFLKRWLSACQGWHKNGIF